jgi:hypothetical protein
MDNELMLIQMEHDFNELAEQYDGAAENEETFALGAPTAEATEMHLQNVVQNREMAKFYRYLASRGLDLIESFEEEE